MATNISASLPDLILPPGATITVDTLDASAVITQLNVYGFSPAREAELTDGDTGGVVIPIFVYGE